jgi:hypothetical protein
MTLVKSQYSVLRLSQTRPYTRQHSVLGSLRISACRRSRPASRSALSARASAATSFAFASSNPLRMVSADGMPSAGDDGLEVAGDRREAGWEEVEEEPPVAGGARHSWYSRPRPRPLPPRREPRGRPRPPPRPGLPIPGYGRRGGRETRRHDGGVYFWLGFFFFLNTQQRKL